MAQLDETLTAFSSRLPQVHESAVFEEGKINPAWKPARLYAPPAGDKAMFCA
jgi:hypothetical protein